MDGAGLRQKRICKSFIKITQRQNFKTFYTLASTHVCTGGGLPCAFLKTETILKTMPLKYPG